MSSLSSSSSSSSDEVYVSSILQPFLHSLSGEDWNILVSEVGLKNWRNCFEIFHIFVEEERRKKKNHNKEATDKEGNASIILKIYTSLIRILSKNGRNEEIKAILETMKEEEITMDAAFYNALFRSYSERGQMAEISQGFLQMEASGIKPDRHTYEIVCCITLFLSVFFTMVFLASFKVLFSVLLYGVVVFLPSENQRLIFPLKKSWIVYYKNIELFSRENWNFVILP